jgi:hypothetical protein
MSGIVIVVLIVYWTFIIQCCMFSDSLVIHFYVLKDPVWASCILSKAPLCINPVLKRLKQDSLVAAYFQAGQTGCITLFTLKL